MRMGHGLRSALRLAATVAAAAAVARAAESARRFFDQLEARPEVPALPPVATSWPTGSVVTTAAPDMSPTPGSHPFGPAPSVVPSRGIGFRTTAPPPRAEARTDAASVGGSGPDVVSPPTPIDRLIARRNADSGPVRVPTGEAQPTAPTRPAGKHRRDVETDSSSTLRVEVLDEDHEVIAVKISSSRHAEGAIARTEVVVAVKHPATGDPATGDVTLTAKDIGATVTLVDGSATLRLTGRAAMRGKLRIDYLGDDRTRPASVTIRLG